MPEFIVNLEEEGSRLDAFLASHDPEISRSGFQRLIEEGCVTVDGFPSKASYKLREGEMVRFSIPPPKPTDILPEELPLEIVFEDDDLIVLNKPKGMVVHPAPGAEDGTLVNALLAHCKGLSNIGGVERPGIVHRLDKDTSGLMVVAKNDAAHHALQAQIQAKTANRSYLVLVWGNPGWNEAIVDAPIGRHPGDRKKMAVIESTSQKSREAATEFEALERFGNFTLLEARLQTGRTHQVRVHASFAGYPVVGDPTYSGNRRLHSGQKGYVQEINRLIEELHGQALHAYKLSFDHPKTGERMEFTAPPPPEMGRLIEYIRGNGQWLMLDG